ncbi:MAG: Gfo/Idh/MocA family oxidoreductase [Planctomycetota bacterium]|nr:Gfo/Idh/MocA family oxidoreductase [Planctomycetota bacterium]
MPPKDLHPTGNDSKTLDRRTVLKHAATLGAAAAVVPLAFTGCAMAPRTVRHDTLRHACIGVGGMGEWDMKTIGSHDNVQIVAICDVDEERLATASGLYPDARRYTDWRALLASEGSSLDSINVSTPDHMHAPITMSALHDGLHVYCQKPLTHTVFESRRIADVARRVGAITQMGIQNHSLVNFRRAHRIFSEGVTGPVREVHVWTDRAAGWWPQGVERTPGSDPIPVTLDWNGWLGVAPERPYLKDQYTPFTWRGRKDFGTGAQGDMACHLMDPVPWFLGVRDPLTIRSEGPRPNNESFPLWSEVHYDFESANEHCDPAGVHLVWHDGGRKPDALLAEWGVDDPYANAAFFVGDSGALLVSPYEDCRLFTTTGESPLTLPELPEINHWHQWVNACFGREEATTPFAYAGPITEIALLGNIALEFPGETLDWDSRSLSFPSKDAATALVSKAYRRGWNVPMLKA